MIVKLNFNLKEFCVIRIFCHIELNFFVFRFSIDLGILLKLGKWIVLILSFLIYSNYIIYVLI